MISLQHLDLNKLRFFKGSGTKSFQGQTADFGIILIRYFFKCVEHNFLGCSPTLNEIEPCVLNYTKIDNELCMYQGLGPGILSLDDAGLHPLATQSWNSLFHHMFVASHLVCPNRMQDPLC